MGCLSPEKLEMVDKIFGPRRMSWKEYYQDRSVVLLGERNHVYKKTIDGLKIANADLLPPDQHLTFALGGFYNAWTVASFVDLSQQIHPGSHDYILIDKNQEPFSTIDPQSFPNRVFGTLEELELPPESIDFMILDFTLNFMNKKQITTFAGLMGNILTPNGLILACVITKEDRDFWQIIKANLKKPNPVHNYYYSTRELIQTLAPLKPVVMGTYQIRSSRHGSMLALSRSDARFPKCYESLLFLD